MSFSLRTFEFLDQFSENRIDAVIRRIIAEPDNGVHVGGNGLVVLIHRLVSLARPETGGGQIRLLTMVTDIFIHEFNKGLVILLPLINSGRLEYRVIRLLFVRRSIQSFAVELQRRIKITFRSTQVAQHTKNFRPQCASRMIVEKPAESFIGTGKILFTVKCDTDPVSGFLAESFFGISRIFQISFKRGNRLVVLRQKQTAHRPPVFRRLGIYAGRPAGQYFCKGCPRGFVVLFLKINERQQIPNLTDEPMVGIHLERFTAHRLRLVNSAGGQ